MRSRWLAVASAVLILSACAVGGSGTGSRSTTSSPSSSAGPGTADVEADETTTTTPYRVVVADGRTTDDERRRLVPYRAFAPAGVAGPIPVILVSHGGRGSSRGYTRGGHLGSTFAAKGYLAIHVGHVASRGRPGQQRLDRPADVSFILDQLGAGALKVPDGFDGTPDLARVGHTGHSFGAYTAHAVAGATFDRSFRDPRVDAIAPISPQGTGPFRAYDRGPDDNTWATVSIPSYTLVGDDEVDTNAIGTIDRPGWRLTPFRHYPAEGDKVASIIADQSHSDMWRTGSRRVETFIAEEISAFFDVYVSGDREADACAIGSGALPGTTTERLADSSDTELAACT